MSEAIDVNAVDTGKIKELARMLESMNAATLDAVPSIWMGEIFARKGYENNRV